MTDKLFTPLTIGSLTLPNRIAMAPMTRGLSPNNIPNEQVVEYYRLRAQGGVGLIITEGTCVNHKAANGYENIPFFYGQESLAGWKKVVDAVHKEGGKIMPQLWHVGMVRRIGTEPDPTVPGYGPSSYTSKSGKVVGHTMTQQDIDDVIEAFAQAAFDAQQIGCDGVEIHGAHGYLIDQFFWQGSNQRDDKYGGSLSNRSRFACEIISAIRARVSAEFTVMLRWSQWKQQDYTARLAQTPEELAEFLQPLSDAGVDIFHCSTRRYWESEFEGSDLNLAGWVKKLTGKPTMTVGSVGLNNDFMPQAGETDFRAADITNIDNLVNRMTNDEFDLVAVGRALIANPNWPNLVQQGKMNEANAYSKEMLESLI